MRELSHADRVEFCSIEVPLGVELLDKGRIATLMPIRGQRDRAFENRAPVVQRCGLAKLNRALSGFSA
jgi:hypothetical protein